MNTALQHICLFIYCICLHLWLTYVDVPMCSQEMINDNHTNAWKSLWCQIMQLNLVAVNTVRTHLKHYSFPNTSHRILIIIITIITIIIIIIIIIIMIIMIRQFIRCHNMSMKSLQVTTLLQSDAAFTYLLTYLLNMLNMLLLCTNTLDNTLLFVFLFRSRSYSEWISDNFSLSHHDFISELFTGAITS